jgi:hypothetical protein
VLDERRRDGGEPQPATGLLGPVDRGDEHGERPLVDLGDLRRVDHHVVAAFRAIDEECAAEVIE